MHTALMPQADPSIDYSANESKWNKIMALRDEVLKVLEDLRKAQTIGSNQEASVQIIVSDDQLLKLVQDLGVERFAALCIVSEVTIEKGGQMKVTADKSAHAKCQRCWNYWPSVGQQANYSDLCSRCAEVVQRQ